MSIRKRFKAGLVAMAMAAVSMFAVDAAKGGEVATGLATDGSLVTVPVDDPGAATVGTVAFPMTSTDTELVGLDYRPRGGGLYAVAEAGTFYVLAPGTMAGTFTATQINQTALLPEYSFDKIGFDFNPAPDAIRLVTDDQDDFRFSPNNGSRLGIDGQLTYAAGDVNEGETPSVVGAAYTNSRDGTGGMATTLYEIDSTTDALVTQGSVNATPVSPNTGQLFTVGALGADASKNVGLDIAPGSNRAFAAVEQESATGSSTLHSIDLDTGAAQLIGAVAGGKVIESLAVLPASVVSFPATAISVDERAGTVEVAVTRTGGLSREVTVDYAATGAGQASGTLTFPVNVERQVIEVPIADEPAVNADRSIAVQLSGAGSNAIVGERADAAVTVIDNPRQPGAPVVLTSVLTSRIGEVAGKGRVRVAFSCSKACSARFTLRFAGRKIGGGSGVLGKAGKRAVTIKLGPNARKFVKRKAGKRKVLQLALSGRFTSPDAAAVSQALKFRVTR